MSELDQVRATIAREAGLDDRAAVFLTGDTVEAIEATAVSLAKLLGERAEQEVAASEASDPISASLGMKAKRRAALVQALHGQPAQARDQAGRFAKSTGFDGGAREPMRVRRSPEAEHGQLIGQMAAISRTFRG